MSTLGCLFPMKQTFPTDMCRSYARDTFELPEEVQQVVLVELHLLTEV